MNLYLNSGPVYVNKVKVVPATIGELITPIGMAYWFHWGWAPPIQDDGAKAGKGFLLHTDGFAVDDVKFITTRA